MGSVLDLAIGFHGTSSVFAQEIMHHGFKPTTGAGHWLGIGRSRAGATYLFTEPSIALGWAREKVVPQHGGHPVVLQILWAQDRCLDLCRLDTRQEIARFGQTLLDAADPAELATLRQDSGRRELDDFVLTEFLNAVPDGKYRSVRAICAARETMHPLVYPPSGALYADGERRSWFDVHDHIQVAVLDQTAILRIQPFDHSTILVD